MNKNLNEERHDLPRWWLSPSGELSPCDDHEFSARQVLRRIPDYEYGGIRATYDQIFALGWVRVVKEPDQIVFDTTRPITRVQRRALLDLAVEQGIPLYDAVHRRVVDEAVDI